MRWIVQFFGLCLLFYVQRSGAIICYQCADSSGNDNADCYKGTYELSVQRSDYEKDNRTLSKFPALKNCDHYLTQYGTPKYQYCKIEKILSYGNINAYIRDCSTGSDFSADLNVTRLSYVKADNQSTCGYSHRHLANICVQFCTGDFCNGPRAGQAVVRAGWLLTFVTVIISMMCFDSTAPLWSI